MSENCMGDFLTRTVFDFCFGVLG